MKKTFLTLGVAMLTFSTNAQSLGCQEPIDSTEHNSAFEEKAVQFSSGDHTPFWLTANRYGLSSTKKSAGYVRAGVFHHESLTDRFSWSAGADFAVAGGYTSTFIVQQLYAGVRYRCLDLTVGSKERHTGFTDPTLSSGDMLQSIDARPVPQARIAVDRYTYIPFTKHKLAFKGYFSMGAFTDQDWQYTFTHGYNAPRTKGVLYHSKGLFLRWGDTEKMPLTVEGGLEMAAQWGGKAYLADGRVINAGHSFKDMMKAIFPSGSSSSNPDLAPDAANAAGNHVGQWSLAVAWNPNKADWGVRAYYQHFFEDHSQMFFDYLWRDMLLGVEAKLPKNRFVSKVVYEYLITKDQSGPVYNDASPSIPEQVSGRDNYYNNWLYGAWQHWGMAMGNPLLLSPIYNADHRITFYHNRVKAHHIGFSGNPTAELQYRVLFSYTRSWGTYSLPTPEVMKNVNAMLEVNYAPKRFKSWSGKLALAADGGSLMGHNYGVMFSICKNWRF